MTRFLTLPILYALLAALMVAAGFAALQTLRLANETSAHLQTKVDHAKVLANLAELTARALAEVRARESQYRRDSESARRHFEQEKRDALDKKNRVIADLRSGALRLQSWWECPALPAAGDAAAGAAVPGADRSADLRNAGVGDLLRIGANADTLIRFHQLELLATRKACGVAE